MPRLMADRTSRMRRGFTLVEFLVVIMILGIVGGAVFRVLVKQQQSYKDSSKQAAMQRELRLAGSFLPSEIRSASSAGLDVKTMEEGEVVFLANIGSGVICDRSTVAQIIMPPLSTANVTLTNWYTQPQNGDSVFLYDEGPLSGSEDDVWVRRSIASINNSSTACPGAPYTDPVLDAGKLRWRVNLNGGALPDSVKLGAVVRFARPMRYQLYQASSKEWYIGLQEYVQGGWSTMEAVGGPFRPFQAGDANPSGLQFRYFDSLGVRLASTDNPSRLSRIDVFLRTNAGLAAVTERRPNDVRDSVMMRIGLRNFK
jgi:prepilin-type N-terminal cleavage/methylation domain-containing protein